MALAMPRPQEVAQTREVSQAAERAPQPPALTGLRFFAALLVILDHFTVGSRVDLIPTRPGFGVAALGERALRAIGRNPILRLPDFVLGIAVGRLFVLARTDQWPGRAHHPGRAAIGALACFVLALATTFDLPYALHFSGMLNPFAALVIYTLAWGQGRAARVLALAPVIVLGEASYALYLLHMPVWAWIAHYLAIPPSAPAATDPTSGLLLVAQLSGAIALSIGLLRYIEQPGRQLLRTVLGGASSRP